MASSSGKKKITPAASWKGRRVITGVELELPSGNTCLVRPVSIAEMISEDMLPDTLLPIVQGHIDKGSGKRPQDKKPKAKDEDSTVDAVMQDPKKIAEMFGAIDKLVSKIVIEPEVHFHKKNVADEGSEPVWELIPGDERDEDDLYTDEVDLGDKMFIFQWVSGGTTDLERFRGEFGAGLDSVQSVAEHAGKAK